MLVLLILDSMDADRYTGQLLWKASIGHNLREEQRLLSRGCVCGVRFRHNEAVDNMLQRAHVQPQHVDLVTQGNAVPNASIGRLALRMHVESLTRCIARWSKIRVRCEDWREALFTRLPRGTGSSLNLLKQHRV